MNFLFAILLVAQVGHLAPVSDAARERGFPSYAKKLKSAISKRDSKALRKLVDEDVIVGGFTGKDEKGWTKFAERWEVDRQDSPVWDVLADLLELGVFREAPQTLVAPYLAWKFPRDLDPETHLVVLRDSLPLRATPDRNGAVLATLSFDIVRRLQPLKRYEAFEWIEVETLAGKKGFVQAEHLRSPLMSRAQFGYKSGQWYLLVLDRGKEPM